MLPTLVINLDRSTDRWEKVRESTRGTGLDLQRIAAIDGRDFPAGSPRPGLDETGFQHNHGRKVLAGEYGCYKSHLLALGLVLERGYDLAIIAEDDVLFNADVEKRVRATMGAGPEIELLKLINHRTSAFVKHGSSLLGDEFGRCLHGPLGSAACYAVTRDGARKLLESLATMWLPYDIAFERGWSTDVATYTARRPLVRFQANQGQTTIATRDQYRNSKLPKISQANVLWFRTRDYVRRVIYALRKE